MSTAVSAPEGSPGSAGSIGSAGSVGSAGHRAAVTTRGLTKRFGHQAAVDDLAIDVPMGAVYGFLGPNGSGKTTTIRMLLGLVRPSAGSATVLGHAMPDELAAALPRVGALVEGPAFHPYLDGRANLRRLDAADRFADPSTAKRRVDAALDRVGLLPAATKRFRAYSLGMKQRLALAGALLAPRDLFILDEPTNGLDPQGTREVRALVGELADEGATVLVSSHLLSEIEQVCTHLGIMKAGRLVAQGSSEELLRAAAPTVVVRTPDVVGAATVLERLGLAAVSTLGQTVRAEGRAGLQGHEVVTALVQVGVRVDGFSVTSGSLEDLFVSLTGEGFDVSS